MRRFQMHTTPEVDQHLIGWSDATGEGPNVSIPLASLAWWEEEPASALTTLHLHNGTRIVLDFSPVGDGGEAWSDFGTALLAAHQPQTS